jgi:hypothetical protein
MAACPQEHRGSDSELNGHAESAGAIAIAALRNRFQRGSFASRGGRI